MKIKASELTGPALDWAVAKCEGDLLWIGTQAFAWGDPQTATDMERRLFTPSTDWSQGGPIIEREGITIVRCDDDYEVDDKGFCTNVRILVWGATTGQHSLFTGYDDSEPSTSQYESDLVFGPTSLIAAMRCYVASKLGDEVEVPEELI